jgi:ABC-type bacteriocin/lantibiotic exporter with double-glycine peptidase domain
MKNFIKFAFFKLLEMVIKIPYYNQSRGLSSCGPTCLRMIFEFHGRKYSETELIEICNTIPNHGTSHEKMKMAAKNKGLKATEGAGTIKKIKDYLNNNNPVIVNFINPRTKKGHYSIINGYDKDSREFIFADPSNGNGFRMKSIDFNKSWQNSRGTSKKWLLVVSE